MQHRIFRRRPVTPAAFAMLAVVLGCGDALSPGGVHEAGGDVDLPSPVVTYANPVAGASFWVDPSSKARRTADDWRATRPTDAAQLDKIAAQPIAKWFGNWNTDVRGDVASAMDRITATGALPVLVAYNIPLRDCGSYSAGGANGPSAYRSWIDGFAAGLGGREAIVVLEPDALGNMGCLSAADQATRLELIRHAVTSLSANGALFYIDAGNVKWHPASRMAERLRSAGIDAAAGFALNVSNFFTTRESADYGDAISDLVGGKHYLIDTSRNGNGATADAQWCNPPERALGDRPTTATGRARADAYLWIKVPGESDGSCNGNPKSGTWMPEYALGLAQRAAY